VGLALILFLLQGIQSGISALLGGLAYCAANFLFVWQVFSRATQSAQRFIAAFILGESAKLLISAILVVLTINYLPVKVVSVLMGYCAAIFGFWIVSFVVLSRPGAGTQP
jgi:F0F1-type ATP synthase assembly protein I